MPSHTRLSPLLRHYKKNIQFRTAQLHILSNPFTGKGEERTPVFRKEGILHLLSRWKRKRFSGSFFTTTQRFAASLTIEAALVLPLFVVSICFLMMPMVILDAQAEAQYQLEKTAELASGAACLKQIIASEEKEVPEDKLEEYLKSSPEFVTAAAYVESRYPKSILGTPIPTMWKVSTDSDPMITFRITSVPVFPLTAFLDNHWGIIGVISSRRAWVGREGGAGKEYAVEAQAETGEEETGGEEDRIVYVARNATVSGRYHVSATCHYISNRMTAVSVSDLSSMRTENGSRYHACSACKPSSVGTVYIFPSSNLYHASTGCKAIQSFAVEMKESEAQKKGYSPCSYCGKK